LEDKFLVWKFNNGDSSALSGIYEKYRDDLLRLGASVLNNMADAEDVVQEVFIAFAKSAGDFKLTGSLRGFLSMCVVNRARNYRLANKRKDSWAEQKSKLSLGNVESPEQLVINREQIERICNLMSQLCNDQREVISLRLYGKLKFREIALLQKTPIRTVQSRYRLGLEKLRILFSNEE